MTNALLLPLGVLLFVALVLGAAALGRHLEVRRRRRQRIVEKPNSHHTWERVKEIEKRERWHDIPLHRIHEVNRDEVVRLLARVTALGPDALRPYERRFLDQMADLAGVPQVPDRPSAADRGARAQQPGQDLLQHRPA